MEQELDQRDREVVWETVAQLWVDAEWSPEDLDVFAARLADLRLSMAALDHIVRQELCGGLATDTLGTMLSFGMGAHDYEYPPEEVRRRVQRFVDHPIRARLNPVWWLGFASARWFLSLSWPDLRDRTRRLRARSRA